MADINALVDQLSALTVLEAAELRPRLEAVLKTWNGWRGAFGLQFGSTDFSAVGAEAFVPSTVTDTVGLFVLLIALALRVVAGPLL
mgnify:CR=1 FL=1